MKSLTSLWSCLADELARRCCTSATRDIKTVASRTEREGLWFLAVVLADLGKAIEKWLDQGFVDPNTREVQFTWDPKCKRPRFLGGFMDSVFDPSSGALLEKPSIEAIFALRQLTLLFAKIALPGGACEGTAHSVVRPDRESEAMSEYIQCEQDVKEADARLDPAFMADFKRMSALLFGKLLDSVDSDVRWGRLIPKHGPGAVADKLSSNGKFSQQSWTTRLDRDFGPLEWFRLPNLHYLGEVRSPVPDVLEPGAEIPVRVITVPKTLKTPRIIAIEPSVMQYAQQALLRSILNAWEQDGFLSRVIGFDNQDPNRDLARRGSLSGDLATLDLSEASDRVSYQHVRALLAGHPRLLGAVDACRSRKADVPGHGVIRLSKYASMGSALCFPFEAMVFLTIIFLGIERELSAPLSCEADVNRFRKQVRVFGDDLIVPRDYVLSVVSELELFGFAVNAGKSFWTGRFRESCGRAYFSGEDVSIVRVREIFPTQRQDASAVISAVSLRNQLYWAGLWQGAAWMDDLLGGVLRHYPMVARTSALLGRESVFGYSFRTLDPLLSSPITKGYFVKAESPTDPLSESGALLKCLLKLDVESQSALPSVDTEHLERSGRPEHVGIKLGWRSPF